MRTVKLIFLAVIAIVLITVGSANTDRVTLTLFPAEFEPFTQFNASVTLPLYAVVFGGLALGILLGFFWEWMREAKHRSKARRAEKAAVRLSHEVKDLKRERAKSSGDEVLALLEDAK